MRIGLVAYWFNRGQAVVARQIRSALEDLGHETFVLARPTRKTNIRPDWIDREGVWAQEGVTAASDYRIPLEEYMAWADDVQPDVVLFDQNYQFPEITPAARARGPARSVDSSGSTSPTEHVEAADGCLRPDLLADRLPSSDATRRWGSTPSRVRWGCFPELVELGDRLRRNVRSPAGSPPTAFPAATRRPSCTSSQADS